jgi:hypothetical protein
MDGHCGYAFPCGGRLRVQRYVSESAGEQSFILLMLDHGKDPTDADYCYVMYPYADREKMLECTAAPDFKILSNTKACQAVSEEQTGLCCYVFYEPGECGALKVDKPCLVTVSKDKLMVCDPTQELDSVRITLDGREFVAHVCGKRGARIDFDI